jgi:hypothetical protein
MRRIIEVFQGKAQTSYFSLDSFFSSLPLLTANCIIATDLHKTNTWQKILKPQITQRGLRPQPKKMEPQITQITQINKKNLRKKIRRKFLSQKHCYKLVSSCMPKYSCQKNKKFTDSITDYTDFFLPVISVAKKLNAFPSLCTFVYLCG